MFYIAKQRDSMFIPTCLPKNSIIYQISSFHSNRASNAANWRVQSLEASTARHTPSTSNLQVIGARSNFMGATPVRASQVRQASINRKSGRPWLVAAWRGDALDKEASIVLVVLIFSVFFRRPGD